MRRIALIAAAVPFATFLAPATTAATSRAAQTARTLDGNAEAHLRYLRSSGSTLVEEGKVTGGISGHMSARLHVGATFSGTFTFYTHGGEITGRGSAHPHGSGRYESFSGTDTITGGTGRYVHVTGHGSMYGTFDRKTYDVTIQTRGELHY